MSVPDDLPVEGKWLRLGAVLLVLEYLFLILLVGLLRIDVTLALAAAVVASTVGGIALVVYLLDY